MSHTLHFCSTEPHAAVPSRYPQLNGVSHLHEAMHSAAVSVPCGSGLQFPVEESQLYILGGGVCPAAFVTTMLLHTNTSAMCSAQSNFIG